MPSSPSADFPLDFQQLLGVTLAESYGRGVNVNISSQDRAAAQARLIHASLDAGVVDLMAPVSSQGHGSLVAWDEGVPDGLPLPVLLAAAAQNSALGPDLDGQPAFLQALGCMAGGYTKPRPHRPLDWIQVASAASIAQLDAPGQAPGQGLLDWFSGRKKALASQFKAAHWQRLDQGLLAKGVDWAGPGICLPRSVPAPLLDVLCQRGLDLTGLRGGQPLWQWLLALGRPEITQVVSHHAHGAGEQAARTAADGKWLAGFGQLANKGHDRSAKRKSGDTAAHRQEIISYLVSRPDWHGVVDHMGRSAFFHAILAEPGILRYAMERAQASPSSPWKKALEHRDHAGRNVWFYLLPQIKHNTLTEKLLDALAEHVPSPMDVHGRKWLQQLLDDVPGTLAAMNLPGYSNPRQQLPVVPKDSPAHWHYGAIDLPPGEAGLAATRALIAHPRACDSLIDALSRDPRLPALQAWSLARERGLKELNERWAQPKFQAWMEAARQRPLEMLFPVGAEAFGAERARLEAASAPGSIPRDTRQALDFLETLALQHQLNELPEAAPPRRTPRM